MSKKHSTPEDHDVYRSTTLLHALYKTRDVEGALEQDGVDCSVLSDVRDLGTSGKRGILKRMLDAGEPGRWRSLAFANAATVRAVETLDGRAPHLHEVSDIVLRRLQAARNMRLPIALPPLLLLGPPGVGKTWYMSRLAAALGVPFGTWPMNLATLGAGLSGSHCNWKGSAVGLVAKTLLIEQVANPMILIDELDKPPAMHAIGDLFRPIYSLFEAENAKAFVDEHLGLELDASRILWIASANSVENIPEPILDRLIIVQVGAMTEEQQLVVLRSIATDLNAHYQWFFETVPDTVFETLVALPPRRGKLALEDAMIRAAADGRRLVQVSDVIGVGRAPKRMTRRRGVH